MLTAFPCFGDQSVRALSRAVVQELLASPARTARPARKVWPGTTDYPGMLDPPASPARMASPASPASMDFLARLVR